MKISVPTQVQTQVQIWLRGNDRTRNKPRKGDGNNDKNKDKDRDSDRCNDAHQPCAGITLLWPAFSRCILRRRTPRTSGTCRSHTTHSQVRHGVDTLRKNGIKER